MGSYGLSIRLPNIDKRLMENELHFSLDKIR